MSEQENNSLILKFIGIKNENSEKNLSICVNLLKQQKELITLNNNLNDFIEHTKKLYILKLGLISSFHLKILLQNLVIVLLSF